ncbi:Lysophospholipase [Klebsormidium nitens]|uniref:Lysophospholipase n=1 Tax=Klebsormidium nitens TaxID=105231 RepID=A0A1Y1HTT2_KLENI|nr:Lysophospholipase [Klebsormidium nitens]|eukprot:GAQ79936.1 Lysophospholipase [Klebsormidium nitens]
MHMSGALSPRGAWFRGFAGPPSSIPSPRKPTSSIRGVKIACSVLAQNAALLLLCTAVDHVQFSTLGVAAKKTRWGSWGSDGDRDGFGGFKYAAAAAGVAGAETIAVVPEGLPRVAEIPAQEDEASPVPGLGVDWEEHNWLPGFTSVSGTRLHTVRYLPPKNKAPKGFIFLWHGFTDHIGTLAHVAKAYAEAGYAAYGLDFPGHGRSEGLRGYVPSVDQHLADALRYVDAITGVSPVPWPVLNSTTEQSATHALQRALGTPDQRWRQVIGKPLFLWGQSLGGAMCLRLAIERPHAWDGMVVLAPAISIADDLEPNLQRFARYASAVWPTMPVTKVTHGSGSRNPAVTKWESEDPLRFHGHIRVGSVAAIMGSCRFIMDRLPKIVTPFIVIQGSLDTIVAPRSAKILADRASSGDKTLKMFPHAWHDLVHEPESPEIVDMMLKWVEGRTAKTLKYPRMW